MQRERYLGCLAADQAVLRAIAAHHLTTPVPTCPGWTLADLTRHVAVVYLHKIETMRRGEFPRPWPPPALAQEEPVALLDRTYAELHHELAARSPADPARTFFRPDQTVGFWLRRMAHETLIHRVDAELAVRVPVGPAPESVAVDGVDEVLHVFLEHGSGRWPERFAASLAGADGGAVRVEAGGRAWLVRLAPDGVRVADGADDGDAAVSGAAFDVLRWLWRRTDDHAITTGGDPAVVARLRRVMRDATQ